MEQVKPTKEQALRRLRLDDSLADDVADAIEQAFALTEKYLDGPLYVNALAAAESGNPKAIVCTADIIAAQLLLVDSLCGPNSVVDQTTKKQAAYDMLRIRRNQGV
ncbi:hypothetical protein [Comamonas sp.]|uniref:hypothetical protein n=1 Tax=Comamonas sp. TaxID=34028 RepID=UPI003D09AA1F